MRLYSFSQRGILIWGQDEHWLLHLQHGLKPWQIFLSLLITTIFVSLIRLLMLLGWKRL